MKKFIIFIILSIITQKAISKNWELDKNGINYNQAISENLTLPNEITKPNIYIYDDFNTPLDSGTTHGGFVLGLMKKISNFQEIREEVPFSSEDFEISLVSDFLGETNIVNLSYKTDFTGYAGVNIYHGFNKHNYIVTTAANENSSNNNDLCFNEDVICVAATNSSGIKTYYSGYGENVDIAAPGGEKNTNRFKDLKDLQKIFPRLDLVYDGFYLYENINGLYININETYSNQQYNKKAMLLNNQPVLTKLALAYAINKVNNNNKYTIIDELTGNYNQNLPNISHIKFVNAIKTISNLPNNPEPLYVNGYTEEGTSFAAPYVTITLANILEKLSESSELKDISREQVLDLLYMSGDYVPTFDNYSTCQNINNILNIGEVTNGIYTQNLSLINNPTICNAAKIRIPRKINFYQSLYNASFVLPTTIKTTGESDIFSNSNSLREFSEDGKIWGAYRKSNELDVLEINHNLLIDEDLKAKNLTIDQGVTVKFNYDIDVSVGNMFDNQGTIEGCFSDTCNHIGSLEFTGKASYFKNEGSIDIDSGAAGIYQGGGELIVKDSCSVSLKNPDGEITVLYNENSCQLEAKKITYKPTEFNISRHNINNFNISGEHYKEDSIVVLDKSDSSVFYGYNTNYFDVYKLILNDNLEISGKFSTKTMLTYPNNQETFNISLIEGYNYDLKQWQLDNLFFDELTLRSTIVNTYQANNIYASDFYFINSEINGEPSLFVNYFVNRGSTLNLSNLTVERKMVTYLDINGEPYLAFDENFNFINLGVLNISDTLKLENLGEINASDFVSKDYNINKLYIGKGTHLKIDVDLEIGDLELDNSSSIEIYENKTLNIRNITTTNQLNDINNNSYIYGEGFIGINNFICTGNRVTDFGDINVSFYDTKFGSSSTICTVIADKANFVDFQNNPSKTTAYGKVKVGNDTRITELYFNSDFNYPSISFYIQNSNSNIHVNADVNVKELILKNGKIINNGNLSLFQVYTNIGSFYEGNEINNSGYIRFQGNNILFDSKITVNKPYFSTNAFVEIGDNITLQNIAQNISFQNNNSGIYTLTIEGICNREITYLEGSVNLENIQLYNRVGGRYPKKPCTINANEVNLNSFDSTFDQQDIYGNINNLNIYTQSPDEIEININGNLNNYSDYLNLTPYSSINGDINNYGNLDSTSTIIHLNGYINNNGIFNTPSIKTNVLGNRNGNPININSTSIQGMGTVETLSSDLVENLIANSTDKVVLNHDFTFINSRVYNFEGVGVLNLEDLCYGHYKYLDGIVNLDNIKFERHSPNRSYGCEITAGDVFLNSYDTTYNNKNMLIHGNLTILTGNENDSYHLNIDNGNLFIQNNSILNIENGTAIDTELLEIEEGSEIFSTGGIKIFDTDVINNGLINVAAIYSSRIGHFNFDKLINTGSYILEAVSSETIHVESSVKVDNLRVPNKDNIIILDYPLTINNTNSILRFSGSEDLIVKGLCRDKLYFENGNINLIDIKLIDSKYNTCKIESNNTYLFSFDKSYNSKKLIIEGNLIVVNEIKEVIELEIYEGNLILNNNLNLYKLSINKGNLILNNNVNLKVTMNSDLNTELIEVGHGAKFYTKYTIKSYDSDIILNGEIETSNFETSRLGHVNANKLKINSYTVSGYDNSVITVENEGSVSNIRIKNPEHVILMNHPFTFEGTRSTLNFEGSSKVTITDVCRNEIFYKTGIIDLVDVKLNLHKLIPGYGGNPSHGCLITANTVNLNSLNTEFNNRDLIVNGNINIYSNSEDFFSLTVNGDIFISEIAKLYLGNSNFNGESLINHGEINVNGEIFNILHTDILNEGFFYARKLRTERLGQIKGSGLFETEEYYIVNKETVRVESESVVNNLIATGGKLNIIMDYPFEFKNLNTNLTLSGNKTATLSELCKKEVIYNEGLVKFKNIQLKTDQYYKCDIKSNLIIDSFNESVNQSTLYSTGQLSVNGNYLLNNNSLRFNHVGNATINSNLTLASSSNFNNELTINGNIYFKGYNYTQNGNLLNNGNLKLDSSRYLIINGEVLGSGNYEIQECKFKLNDTIYKYPNELIECN